MATFEGVWIRYEGGPRQLADRLRALGREHSVIREIPELSTGAGSPWSVVQVSYEHVAPVARVLSAELRTPCVGLVMQSVVDAFGFWLYENGREVRRLVHGVDGPEERSWEQVAGEPEPWEDAVLWSRRLEDVLEWTSESERDAVRARIEERQILVGHHLPTVGVRSAVTAVLQHYGMPTSWPMTIRVGPVWPLRSFRAFW